jgi:hypothetical protein
MAKALPLIITDLDGTLINLLDELLPEIYRATGIALEPECHRTYMTCKAFSPYLCPPGEPAPFGSAEALDEFLTRTCFRNPDVLRRARPYWKLWRTLLWFQQRGGKVVALTSRNKDLFGLEDVTKGWLAQWLNGTKVYFSRDFKGANAAEQKHDACLCISCIESEGAMIFIDDEPSVAKTVAGRVHNCTVLVPDRPWTRNVEGLEVCDVADGIMHVVADAEGIPR